MKRASSTADKEKGTHRPPFSADPSDGMRGGTRRTRFFRRTLKLGQFGKHLGSKLRHVLLHHG